MAGIRGGGRHYRADEMGAAVFALAAFEIAPSRKEVLLKGLDDIGTTLQHAAEIDAYEKAHAATATMYDPVDVKYYSNGR